MPKISRDAWKGWIESPDVLRALLEGGELLKSAWESDQQGGNHKYKDTYPVNTDRALTEILERVSKKSPKVRRQVRRVPPPKIPMSLAELIPEKLVKSVWELHHQGSFRDAIKKAASFNPANRDEGWKSFRGILWAIENAYAVGRWGSEVLPGPKVNILHLGLNQIARAAGLGDQTEQGFAQFLDSLCPCGLRNHRESVRKLVGRSRKFHRPGW